MKNVTFLPYGHDLGCEIFITAFTNLSISHHLLGAGVSHLFINLLATFKIAFLFLPTL
jgi:hypothetical protein